MADDAYDEDLFADLYDGDDVPAPAAPAAKAPEPELAKQEPASESAAPASYSGGDNDVQVKQEQDYEGGDMDVNAGAWNGNNGNQSYDNGNNDDDNYGPINVKEDGIDQQQPGIGKSRRHMALRARFEWDGSMDGGNSRAIVRTVKINTSSKGARLAGDEARNWSFLARTYRGSMVRIAEAFQVHNSQQCVYLLGEQDWVADSHTLLSPYNYACREGISQLATDRQRFFSIYT
ncbi:hypothetical protein K504DRAFT_453143 [Pleomassaria siparia CBS 279.74]|uniref:Uncharacterized protein n=1 Tax=Pleomassaria siparia CBS 279.74 TaxID=1314801 RepID=A0A6G1KG05_9PLEO|nr:hypothetical protein K504DRAFT_453143 [Pleomassaria siparia CBS 279.74]